MPIALAVAAGMLAVVNPCGFALLPAYASFLVIGDDSPDRIAAIRRALGFALAMTAGFAAVFGVFGVLLSLVSNTSGVQRFLPWFTVVLGIGLLGLGGWLIAGKNIPGMRFGVKGPELTRSMGSMAAFGITYAIASLSCTFVPFLITVVASFRSGSFAGGLAVFGAYALGMGLVVVSVSLAVALAQTTVVTWLRKAGRLVPRIGGGLLLVAGAYVAYYGWYEIRVFRGDAVDDPVIGVGEGIQSWLSNMINSAGVGVFLGAAAALLGAALGLAWWLRRRSSASSELSP
nr:cytochrome c biogenesis protein CcdA [Phytoactinopolyspora mesophila]